MKTNTVLALAFLLLLSAMVSAQQSETIDKYNLWIGTHYTDYGDYQKKVAEYRRFSDNAEPEFGLSYRSLGAGSIFDFNGHFFDEENFDGRLVTRAGDVFRGDFQFRGLTRNMGQDLLEEMTAREWLSTAPGGKILTHDIQDPGADYDYRRREVLSEISTLLSRQHNIKLLVAHRSIIKEGTEQSLSTNHCFSCHMVSQTAEVNERTHAIEAEVQAEVGHFDVAYQVGYRHYESEALSPLFEYDPAKHPVNGGSGPEFASRQNFSDTTLPVNARPKTRKLTNKVRASGNLGKGRFSGSASYGTVENKLTGLQSKSFAAAANYAVMLAPTTRFIGKASLSGISADDPFVDIPTYRRSRPGTQTNFDYTRYSALDRKVIKVSGEVIRRLNPKMTLAILAGLDRVDRSDYPVADEGLASTTLTGQAKVDYRKGIRYNTSLKYRFEKTSDPFVSGRGLFEANGSELLDPVLTGFTGGGDSTWGYFYYQREDLRYQAITTEPTDRHLLQWSSNWRPDSKLSVNLSATGNFDKNGDLDSLDVKHSKIAANLGLTVTPDPHWTLAAGFGLQNNVTRGPVSVALFDG